MLKHISLCTVTSISSTIKVNKNFKIFNKKQSLYKLLSFNQLKHYNKQYFNTSSTNSSLKEYKEYYKEFWQEIKQLKDDTDNNEEEKKEEDGKENFYSKERGYYILDRYSFISKHAKISDFYSQWIIYLIIFSGCSILSLFSTYFTNKFSDDVKKLFKEEFNSEEINVELTEEEIIILKKGINIISNIVTDKKDCKDVFNETFLRNLLIICSKKSTNNTDLKLILEAKRLFNLMITDGSLRLKKFIYNYLLNEYNNLNNSENNKFNYLQHLINETNNLYGYESVKMLLDLQLIYFNLPEYKYLDLTKKEEQFKNDFPKINDLLTNLHLTCKNNENKSEMLNKFEEAKQRNLNLQNNITLQKNYGFSIFLLKTGLFTGCAVPFYYFTKKKLFKFNYSRLLNYVKNPTFGTLGMFIFL